MSMSELKINRIAIVADTRTKFRPIRQFEFINMQFLIKFYLKTNDHGNSWNISDFKAYTSLAFFHIFIFEQEIPSEQYSC